MIGLQLDLSPGVDIVSELGIADLQRKLDDLSNRLRQRREEFQTKGEFSEPHRKFLDGILQRNDDLRKRVADAAHGGSAWEFTKAELWRDLDDMVNEALLFEEKLDAETTRK